MNKSANLTAAIKKAWLIFLVAAFVLALLPSGTALADANAPDAPDGTTRIYFPVTTSGYRNREPLMLGIYPHSYWQPGVQDALEIEFNSVDVWSGKTISIAGVFHSIDQYKTVSNMLPIIWDNGYTPFVNIYFKNSAYTIASGGVDSQIRAWARDFAIFAQGGKRMAFLAPMQEMNGYWVPYGLDPANFKTAFRRIRQIFAEEGVPARSVRWVFAPNGWSNTTDPPLEDYYPGDDYVDAVSFSAYNFGFHPLNPYKAWKTPVEIYPQYIRRLESLAPTKPIFIAQTGTSGYYNSSRYQDVTQKNLWLENAYNLLLDHPSVIGVIYYNANPDYDWAFYRSGTAFTGYCEGVADPLYEYFPPSELLEMNFSIY